VSSLTEQERIGLEEVFMSISSQEKGLGKVRKIKESMLDLFRKKPFLTKLKKPATLSFQAHKRIKIPNFHHLFPKKNKKKKNLS
jgi:hypothetical protein